MGLSLARLPSGESLRHSNPRSRSPNLTATFLPAAKSHLTVPSTKSFITRPASSQASATKPFAIPSRLNSPSPVSARFRSNTVRSCFGRTHVLQLLRIFGASWRFIGKIAAKLFFRQSEPWPVSDRGKSKRPRSTVRHDVAGGGQSTISHP